MADKTIRREYNSFNGLDLGSSDLVRALQSFITADNIELTRTGSISTRKGQKIWAQQSQVSVTSGGHSNIYPFWGMSTYVYTSQVDGTVSQELIGFGDGVYRLATGSMTIAYTGAGTTATVDFLPDGTNFVFNLKVDGSSVYSVSTTGLVNSPTLFSTARNAINALANFTCGLSPSAVVNGNQAGRDAANAITVFNVYGAATQPLLNTQSAKSIEIVNQANGRRLTYDIIASSATTLTIKPYSGTIDVLNNQNLGVALYPLALLPVTSALSVKPTGTINFFYWEKIPALNGNDCPLIPINTYNLGAYAKNYVSRSNNNILYVGAPFSLGYDRGDSTARKTGLLKYDGQSVYAAGVPSFPLTGVTPSAIAGGALTVGTYKYIARYKIQDYYGNITYGTDSYPNNTYPTQSATTAGGNLQISVIAYHQQKATTNMPQYNFNAAVVNGNQVGINVITVTAATHTIRIGDYVTFIDGVTGLITRRQVTAVASTSITVNGTAVNVNNLDHISASFTIEIYRTKVDGNSYYFLKEIPNGTTTASTTFTDNTADTALGIEYDGPFTGNRRKDVPPVVSILENHQGLLVGSGDPFNPQTVYWCNDDSPENWPAGTNNTDIFSTRVGPISALASDNIDMLAVFKSDSYFNIVGDLQVGSFSISSSHQGDVGCPSADGWQKVRDTIIFMSNKGPRFLSNGEILFDKRLASLFINQFYSQINDTAIDSSNYNKIVVRRITSVTDTENQRVMFCLLCEKGTPHPLGAGGSTLSSSIYTKWAVYDYENRLWTTHSTGENNSQNMAGGGAVYNNEIYFTARADVNGLLAGILFKKLNNGNVYDYVDNTLKITPTFAPQWEFLNSPSVDKEFQRIKIYSLPYSNEFAPTTTIRVKTYRNWTSTVDTNATLVLGSGVLEDEQKLNSNKARALRVELTTDNFLDVLFLSGYELQITTPYREEDIQK